MPTAGSGAVGDAPLIKCFALRHQQGMAPSCDPISPLIPIEIPGIQYHPVNVSFGDLRNSNVDELMVSEFHIAFWASTAKFRLIWSGSRARIMTGEKDATSEEDEPERFWGPNSMRDWCASIQNITDLYEFVLIFTWTARSDDPRPMNNRTFFVMLVVWEGRIARRAGSGFLKEEVWMSSEHTRKLIILG
jgi:hypothetical protein